jgi:hypothetical protein
MPAQPRPPHQGSFHSENRKRGGGRFSGVGAEWVFRIGPRSGWLQPPGPKLTPMKLWLVISVLWTVPLAGALLFVLFAH